MAEPPPNGTGPTRPAAFANRIRSRLGVLRSSLEQRAMSTALARTAARRALPGRMRWRAPRAPGSISADVADRARPIHFPQRPHRSAVELPTLDQDVARFRSIGRLRTHSCVEFVAPSPVTDSASAVILSLAAAGVPLVCRGDLGAAVDARLADQLASPCDADVHGRELHSIRLRRRAHDLVYRGTDDRSSLPEISIVLATMRPDEIREALEMAARQRGCRLQVLVGLHGDAWPDDAERVLAAVAPDDTQFVRFPTEVPLGRVLAELTSRADARLVTKWDDDDLYGRDHVADLERAYRYSGADIVGKAAEFVHVRTADATIRRFSVGAESYSWTLAGGTLLTSTSWLADVGGWPASRRSVDRELLERARQAGSTPYRTHGFQYMLVRSSDRTHTWAADDRHFLDGADAVRPGRDVAFADIELRP